MQNTTLPSSLLLERVGSAAAAAAVDTVAYFTRSAFETSSVAFLSPHLVHRICELVIVSILRPTNLERDPRFYFDQTRIFFLHIFFFFYFLQ